MTESSDTPVGQSPAGGGRVKQYASAAERARAFRERQKELVALAKGVTVPDIDDEGTVEPEAAITTLAYAIGELRRIAELQAHFGARIEEAVARVADPARIDAALETAKTHALHQVAEARSVAADARVAAQEARAARAEIATERDAALEEAASALDRLTETEVTAQWLIAEARHFAVVDVEVAEQARSAAEEAVQRAEDVARAEIAQARKDADERVTAAELAIEVAKKEARQAIQAAEDSARAEIERVRAEAAAEVDAAARAAAVATTRAETEAETARERVSAVEQELAAVRAELTEVRAEARAETTALREEIRRERSAAREDRERRETAHAEELTRRDTTHADELARVRQDADERVRTLQTAVAASQAALDAATRRQPSRSTKS